MALFDSRSRRRGVPTPIESDQTVGFPAAERNKLSHDPRPHRALSGAGTAPASIFRVPSFVCRTAVAALLAGSALVQAATPPANPNADLFGSWWGISPAIIILIFPLGFRLTCYYYRKAYYRSFWLAPVACAVRDVKTGYSGETRFPLFLQNLHRYTWYVAVLFIVMLAWDVILAFRFPNGFGIGVGTLVMWINVIFLAGYTFSCHSCRHVCGGHVNVFSKAPGRYRIWHVVTRLNERHPMFAWLSLFSVGLTDLYIRLVSMGVIRDWRII